MDITAGPSGIEKKFFDLCDRVVREEGLYLYDLIYHPGQMSLRVFIMDEKTGSAVIDDCIRIDAALTPYINELDWMPAELNLEVSSPGVYRALKSRDHFARVVGTDISVTLKHKCEGEDFPKVVQGQKKLVATLIGVEDEEIKLKLKTDEFKINYSHIKKATVEQWPEELTSEV